MPSPINTQYDTSRAQWETRQSSERACRSGMGLGELYTPKINGKLTHDYGEMLADISTTPRRSPLTWLKLKIAGHA